MKLRILTGVPLALLVAALLWWGPPWLFLLVLLVAIEIGLHEFFSISRHAGLKALPAIGYGAGAALCLAQALQLHNSGCAGWGVLALILLSTLSLALTRKAELKQYLGAVSVMIFGVLYVAFTLSLLMPLRFSDHSPTWVTGRELVFLLFLVTWAGDIFAYLGGRLLGKRPLFPLVSPRKTVEGAVCGFAGSLLVAWVFRRWFWETADAKTVMLVAGVVALAGQVGDLAESALKRAAELKDSGTLLPGHGGLLDRVDSLLFAAPTLWLVLTLGEILK